MYLKKHVNVVFYIVTVTVVMTVTVAVITYVIRKHLMIHMYI